MAIVRYENQCVGCPPERGCLGSRCKNRNVPIYACDGCGDELDPIDLYVTENDEMLCEQCLLKRFKTVAQDGRGWD